MGSALQDERPFTVEDVYRMVEAGILDAKEHVELLDGSLRVMTPQGPAHSALTVRLHRLLAAAVGDHAHVRDHSNLRLDERNLPEPDVAVIRGNEGDYFEQLPAAGDVLLVVEVAVTSQARDHEKASLYARSGVPEYWLVDVPARRIIVHADPGGTRYAETSTLGDDDQVVVPTTEVSLRVSDLLP